jgi:hypothetical protein
MPADWWYWDSNVGESKPLWGDLSLHAESLKPDMLLFESATQQWRRARDFPELRRRFRAQALRGLREVIFGVAVLAGFAAFFLFLAWVFVVVIGERFEAPPQQLVAATPKIAAVETKFTAQVAPQVFRVDLMRFSNLRIYVDRARFEQLAYPDRREFVRDVANDWCADVKWYHGGSFEVRDATDGSVMARYGCDMHILQMGRFVWQ